MSLPWFAFRIEKYLGDTMTLDTEGHGAYLLLMLHYYGRGKPPRDSDQGLANIARMPIDRWLARRDDLAEFFDIREGHWFHKTIEAELLEASSKHAAAVLKATAAAAVRYGKTAPSMPVASPKRPRSKKNAPSMLRAEPEHPPSLPEVSLKDAHLHIHTTTLTSSSSELKNDDSTKVIDDGWKASENPLGTMLPESWVPDEQDQTCAREYGMPDHETIQHELMAFHAYNAARGAFSPNWKATWQLWCSRFKDREKVKPKPRLVVDTLPTAPIAWDTHVKFWIEVKTWPRGIGPEPGMGGCRCPHEILIKRGIDPLTGRRKEAS